MNELVLLTELISTGLPIVLQPYAPRLEIREQLIATGVDMPRSVNKETPLPPIFEV
jgi:hypothetical protein